MTEDVGDEKQVQSKQNKFKLIRETQLADLHYLITTPQGCRVLWRILEAGKLLATISDRDSHYMAIASGKRDLALWLLAEIDEADKNGYMKLFKESKNA
jgi:hypothetical protein